MWAAYCFSILFYSILRGEKQRRLDFREVYTSYKFEENNRDINAQFIKYEEIMDRCGELGVEILDDENKSDYLYMALPKIYKTHLSSYQQLHKLNFVPYEEG